MEPEINRLAEKIEAQKKRAKFVLSVTTSLIVFLSFDRLIFSLTRKAEHLTNIQTLTQLASYSVALLVYANVLISLYIITKDVESFTAKYSLFNRLLYVHFALIGISLTFSTAVAIWIL